MHLFGYIDEEMSFIYFLPPVYVQLLKLYYLHKVFMLNNKQSFFFAGE